MKKDWNEFYLKGLAPTEPSDFCRWVLSLNIEGTTAVDLGCGNGRDTFELNSKYYTVGIDLNTTVVHDLIAKGPVMGALGVIGKADLVYSRFFLHSISDAEIDAILDATTHHFVAEARIKGDVPKVHPEHERNLIDGQALIIKAMNKGFRLVSYVEGRGMARYKDEDPLVCRIVLTRKP